MELTAADFDYLLNKKYKTVHVGKYDPKREIRCLQMYDDDLPEGGFGISLGGECGGSVITVTGSVPEGRRGWFVLCGTHSRIEAANYCLKTYQEFLRWREAVIRLCGIENDYSKAADLSCAFLDVSMVIIDMESHILYFSRPVSSMWLSLFGADLENDSYDLGGIYEFLYESDPDFGKTYATEGLNYYSNSETTCFYLNIRLGGRLMGRILILNESGGYNPGLFRLLEFAAGELSKGWLKLCADSMEGSGKEAVRSCLRKLISNETVNETELDRLRRFFGGDARFLLTCISPIGYMKEEFPLSTLASSLETLSPGICAFTMGSRIAALYCGGEEKEADFRRTLAEFVRDNLLKAGTSGTFSDIIQCGIYYRQACDALDIGEKTRPDLWLYDFSDYTVDYMFSLCAEKYPPQCYTPKCILKLMRYDAEHPGLDAVDTLRAYFNMKFNGSAAADILHIHRTTFFYRLERIRKISAIDFDSPRDIYEVMTYFAMNKEP